MITYHGVGRCLYFFGCSQSLGRSQVADLHLGQTRGFSGPRGSHSWPQRQRQPVNETMPMAFGSAFFMEVLLRKRIFQ